jgi:hypothetical protein
MSGINFLSENLFDESTNTITTGSANAQYPLSNLKNESTTQKFRSVGNTVVIEVDLGQTREIDTFAIVGDTTTGLGVTAVSFKTSVTNDFTLSPVNNVDLSSEYNIGYLFITEVTHRFVEITLTGNGSFSELSNVFIGKRLNLPLNSFSINSFRYRHDDLTQNKFSDYGQQYSNIITFRKRLVGTIQFCTRSELDDLDEMFLRHGRHKPLWIILDPDSEAMIDGKFKLSQYSYLEKMPSWNAVGGQLYNTSLELNQIV